MTYEQFKRKVFSLAKQNKVGHLIPGNDTLYVFWERNLTPEQVVKDYCTLEAQKERFGPDYKP